MNKPDYRRFDIWWVELDPTRGNEAKKTRPCLILQNDIGNQFSDITMIAPFLEPKSYPFVVNVEASSQNGLDRLRGLNFSQMRVAHYSRFLSKLGVLENIYQQQIERAIAIELDIFVKQR
jgi:mRNA interferase MazF